MTFAELDSRWCWCGSRLGIVFVWLGIAWGPSGADAASVRLSQGASFSDVSDWWGTAVYASVSPDGEHVVYRHDAVVDDAHELWSVPVAGGAPIRLSGILPSGSSVGRFEIAADSHRVVYVARQDSSQVIELYSVPVAGPTGAWVKLNPQLVSGGEVESFAVVGNRVAFIADVEEAGAYDLWSASIEGGLERKHRPTITAVGSVVPRLQRIAVSPEGQRVAFLANFSNLGKWDLWSTRLDGVGGVAKLSGTLVAEGDVQNSGYSFSPDGARVVYLADQDVDERVELYSVPAAGGVEVKLSGPMVAGGDVESFTISPDGSRVVYCADQQVDERIELWSVPIGGGTALKLNGALVAGGDACRFVAISPDSSRVVYIGDQAVDEVFELWSVPIAGGAAVRLNSALPGSGDIFKASFTPDSSTVVYVGDQQTDGRPELYAAPAAGGPTYRLNDPWGPNAHGVAEAEFVITPAGDAVVFRASTSLSSFPDLYHTPLVEGTGDDVLISRNPNTILDWQVHSDGFRVVYVADEEIDERFDLYVGDPCVFCDGFESGDLSRWQ